VASSGIGGAAHLVNFMGTDTMSGVIVAREAYGPSDLVAGFSIPASEHSTITSWGKDKEVDAMRNMLTSFDSGLVACVSDSFDIYNACSNLWGKTLKEEVLKRKGRLVVRPDSGDPATVCVKCLGKLGAAFGTSVNKKGFKVLDDHVRLIQGDGISYESLKKILAALEKKKWSADNIAFGSGGGLLQKMDRDTMKCAFKCSSVTVNGESKDVYKDPVTDKGKVSKKGRFALVNNDGKWRTVQHTGKEEDNMLLEVFRDGKLVKEYTFDEVRKNAEL